MRYLLIILLLSACGREHLPPIGDTGSNDATSEGITMIKVACRQDYGNTYFRYIAIIYPNGDSDVYCGLNWLGENRLYLSNEHHWARENACTLQRSPTSYWAFTRNGADMKAEHVGGVAEEDPGSNPPIMIPAEFTFQNCTTESWDDEYWYNRYYPFNEHLL